MQIKSMTGYGKGVYELPGQKLTIELKAVNHRFLDLGIKLPKGFTFAEDIIRKTLQSKLSRGHVDVYVTYEDTREDKSTIQVDTGLAKSYVEASRNLSKTLGVLDNLGTYELLRMPDVVTQSVADVSEEELTILVREACSNAADNLVSMREKEGALVMADIVQKIDFINQTVDFISKNADKMVQDHREKLTARIKEFLSEVELDESKLLNEVAFYSDRVCVDEEITRLNGHTQHFIEIVQKGGVLGKQLDFLIQEMNRETNTIGSKCCNIEISTKVIALKGTIEKIREQIQNIE